MRAILLAVGLLLLGGDASAQGFYEDERARDRDSGLFAVPGGNSEIYDSEIAVLEGADAALRRQYVEQLARLLFARPTPPPVTVMITGLKSERIVLGGWRDGFFDTEYRARALVEYVGQVGRLTAVMQEIDPAGSLSRLPDQATRLGFTQITAGDGGAYSLEIELRE